MLSLLTRISQEESDRIGMEVAIILFSVLMIPILIGIIVNNVKSKKNNEIFKNQNTSGTQQQKPPQPIQQYQYMPYYLKDSVMTYYETILFSIISDFCKKYNFVLLSKVRLADFIQPLNTSNRSEFLHWFNRIAAKHVDFLVCDPKTIQPLCAVELDDYTHQYKSRQERDEFVDNVYRSVQLPILHIYEVREKYVYKDLAEALNIQLEPETNTINNQ